MLRVDHQQAFGGEESNGGIQAPVKWQGVVSEKRVVFSARDRKLPTTQGNKLVVKSVCCSLPLRTKTRREFQCQFRPYLRDQSGVERPI